MKQHKTRITQLILLLAISLISLAGCSPSATESNGAVFSITKPGVGSKFHLRYQRFREDGSVDTGYSRFDSLWVMTNADTTFEKMNGVSLFRSFYTPEQQGYYTRAIAYTSATTAMIFDDDVPLEQWYTLPLGTEITHPTVMDTTETLDSTRLHITITVTPVFKGVGTIAIGSKTLSTRIAELQYKGVALNDDGQQIADIEGAVTYDFVPELGFFAKRERLDHGRDLDNRLNFSHVVETLTSYELK